MDSQNWPIFRTLARYMLALAVLFLVTDAVIIWLLLSMMEMGSARQQIIMVLVTATAGGLTTLIGGIAGAFGAMVTSKRNVSVAEAQGQTNAVSETTPKPD